MINRLIVAAFRANSVFQLWINNLNDIITFHIFWGDFLSMVAYLNNHFSLVDLCAFHLRLQRWFDTRSCWIDTCHMVSHPMKLMPKATELHRAASEPPEADELPAGATRCCLIFPWIEENLALSSDGNSLSAGGVVSGELSVCFLKQCSVNVVGAVWFGGCGAAVLRCAVISITLKLWQERTVWH